MHLGLDLYKVQQAFPCQRRYNMAIACAYFFSPSNGKGEKRS